MGSRRPYARHRNERPVRTFDKAQHDWKGNDWGDSHDWENREWKNNHEWSPHAQDWKASRNSSEADWSEKVWKEKEWKDEWTDADQDSKQRQWEPSMPAEQAILPGGMPD